MTKPYDKAYVPVLMAQGNSRAESIRLARVLYASQQMQEQSKFVKCACGQMRLRTMAHSPCRPALTAQVADLLRLATVEAEEQTTRLLTDSGLSVPEIDEVLTEAERMVENG